jgi:hypothetical protein
MAVVSIVELKGDPKELLAKYDQVTQVVAQLPVAPVAISHTCVELGDGIRVVNMFETEEQARSARERRQFQQALRDAGMPEHSPTIYRVHNYRIVPTT